MGLADIPLQDRAFLLEEVKSVVAQSSAAKRQGAKTGRARLAILWDPNENPRPSNEEALPAILEGGAAHWAGG